MTKKKQKQKVRNQVLRVILEFDPARLRTRTVKPEKGKGRKDRPRKKNWKKELDSYHSNAQAA